MAAPSSDRNLLFAVLALQNDLVARDALLAGMHAWVAEKHRPLGELLVERGAMKPAFRPLLEALIDAQVQRCGSVEQSLRALDVCSSARRALENVADADVQASISLLVPPCPTVITTEYQPTGSDHRPRYRILRPHAKGGLGEVFVAEDLELHREIALKEIQPEHAGHEASRGRFVLEAEVTGRLEHPGIVPVYGLGHYADGRPFYAMRFIKGDNLKSAVARFHTAKNARFDSVEFRQLLGRFLDVCQAVAYAHSRGVLHRDLKPGNIMLGPFGETLVVDWGLAKVVGRQDVEAEEPTLRPASGSGLIETIAGAAVGTPAFMSPEQAAGRIDQLGPATDVYSLGATLYAVLTNHAPVEQGEVGERLRKVERGDWPAPRQVKPAIPPALESVCLKAMALAPGDRYPTALALAEDLEHWLADEPVSAHREPVLVRTRRWARKHPGVVAALAATVLVGLLGAGTGAAVLGRKNRQLEEARVEAVEAGEKEREAKEQARARLGQMEKANEILGSIFADLDPNAEEKEGKPLREILGERLDHATEALDGEAIGDPLTMAKFQYTLGRSQIGLGYPKKALLLLEKAVETRKARLGEDHPHTLDSRRELATAYRDAGQVRKAILLLEQTLEAQKARLGKDHPDALLTQHNLAGAYQDAGEVRRVIPLLEQTLAGRKAKLGDGAPGTLVTQQNLAMAYKDAGQTRRAIPHFEQNLKAQLAKLGADHPHTLIFQSNLAMAYLAAGQVRRAVALVEQTLETTKAKLGDNHPSTLTCQNNLGMAYQRAGQWQKGILLQEQTLKAAKARLGDDHPGTLAIQHNLAYSYRDTGQVKRALPLFEQALAAKKAKHGDDHPDTLITQANLAMAYLTDRQVQRATALFEQTLRMQKAKRGDDHPSSLSTQHNLAMAYQGAGQMQRAISLLEQSLEAVKSKLGDDHPDTLINQGSLAKAYLWHGQVRKAIPLLEQSLVTMKARLDHDHPSLLATWYDLFAAYEQAEMYDKAQASSAELLPLMRKKFPADHPGLAATLAQLGLCHLRQKNYADAEPPLKEGLAIRQKAQPDDWTTFNTQSALGEALLGQKKHADAEPLLLRGYRGMKERQDKIAPVIRRLRLEEALSRLVQLYEATGNKDEAAKWRKELDALKASDKKSKP